MITPAQKSRPSNSNDRTSQERLEVRRGTCETLQYNLLGGCGSTWVHLKWAKFSSDSLVEEFSKTAREHLYSWVLASWGVSRGVQTTAKWNSGKELQDLHALGIQGAGSWVGICEAGTGRCWDIEILPYHTLPIFCAVICGDWEYGWSPVQRFYWRHVMGFKDFPHIFTFNAYLRWWFSTYFHTFQKGCKHKWSALLRANLLMLAEDHGQHTERARERERGSAEQGKNEVTPCPTKQEGLVKWM